MLKKAVHCTVMIGLSVGLGGTAGAETVYGGLDAAVTYSDTAEEGGSGHEGGMDISGFAGIDFGPGLFAETELRFKDAGDGPNDTIENLRHSGLGALRLGVRRGPLSGEVILGEVSVTTDDGDATARFAALAGGYAVSDRLTLTGVLGYLDPTSGDDVVDAPSDFTSVTLGAVYGLNDRTDLWGTASYGDGVMDLVDRAQIKEVSLGVDHALAAPGFKAYGAVSYGDYFQGTEGDHAHHTQLSLGVTWAFGGGDRTSRRRVALPNYETWIGVAAGTLE